MVGTPPKKRAVPLDDVHVRNMPEYSKRKRSHAYLYDASMRGSDTQGSVAISPPHPTTTRIDRSTRVSREERYQREQQKAQSQRQGPARPRPLIEMPAARPVLAVQRRVDGCSVLLVRENGRIIEEPVGAPERRRVFRP